ncbi:MAG: arsenate reductase family protein, partial [Psychroflexus sp.]
MKKVFHLSTCDTCKRILKQVNWPQEVTFQDIKKELISETELEFLKENSGSYESLMNKRAQKYKQENLKDKNLSEAD